MTLTAKRSDPHHVPCVLVYDARGNGGRHMPDNHRPTRSKYNRLHRYCFAEKRFFKWVEDDRSVSLRNMGGSYGGEVKFL
jgi:hypothetical protein